MLTGLRGIVSLGEEACAGCGTKNEKPAQASFKGEYLAGVGLLGKRRLAPAKKLSTAPGKARRINERTKVGLNSFAHFVPDDGI